MIPDCIRYACGMGHEFAVTVIRDGTETLVAEVNTLAHAKSAKTDWIGIYRKIRRRKGQLRWQDKWELVERRAANPEGAK